MGNPQPQARMRTFYLVANILVVLSAASVDAGPAMRNKRLATCQKKSIVLNKKLAGLKQNIRDALADAFGCSAGMFSANNDDACADWTTADADSCGDGHFWTAGSATSDSSCVECTTGTFSASKNAVCEDWKNADAESCDDGSFWTTGSTTSDSSCVECTTGTFSASKNAACEDWKNADAESCGDGSFWTTGSTTSDSTCVECTTGTFSASKNAACADWKNVDAASCGAGYFWTAGSTTSDSSCVGCTAGTFSASNNAACADWAYPDAASCGAGDWTTGSTTADSTCAEGKMELRWYQTNEAEDGEADARIGYTPKTYASATSFCQGNAVGARMATLLEYCGFDGEYTGKVAGSTPTRATFSVSGFSGGQQKCDYTNDPEYLLPNPAPAYPFDVAEATRWQTGGCNQWAPFGENGDYVQIGGGPKGTISPCTLASEHFGEGWAQQVNSFEFDAQRLVLCAEPMPTAVEGTGKESEWGRDNGCGTNPNPHQFEYTSAGSAVVSTGNPWNGAPWIAIPYGETEIRTRAFYACDRLSEVTIPNTVTHILVSAFEASGLKTITIPSSVVSIAQNAFYACRKLMSITIPSSVTSMGPYIFYAATSLTSAIFLNSPEYIPGGTFGEAYALESFTFPASVTRIRSSTFYNCKKLTQIIIPDSVTVIENKAFAHSGLTSLVIPPSVTQVGDWTFYSTLALKNVTFSSSQPWADCTGARLTSDCKFEAHTTIIKV